MDIINSCFDGIVLVKVENKENFSIYAASLNSSYGDGKKQYLIVFVPSHLAILDKAYLKDLEWENIQTRILDNGYRLPNGKSMPKQAWIVPKGIMNFMFKSRARDSSKTKYVAEGYPLDMILIHDPKKKGIYQYHDNINLIAALLTFRCVISNVPLHNKEVPISMVKPVDTDLIPIRDKPSSSYEIKKEHAKSKLAYQSIPVQKFNVSTIREPEKSGATIPLGESKMKRHGNMPNPWGNPDPSGRGVPDRNHESLDRGVPVGNPESLDMIDPESLEPVSHGTLQQELKSPVTNYWETYAVNYVDSSASRKSRPEDSSTSKGRNSFDSSFEVIEGNEFFK